MTKVLIGCAWIAFLFWQVKRAKEHAAELSASGVLREPLFWIGNTSLTTLGFSMYMANVRPAHIGGGLLVHDHRTIQCHYCRLAYA